MCLCVKNCGSIKHIEHIETHRTHREFGFLYVVYVSLCAYVMKKLFEKSLPEFFNLIFINWKEASECFAVDK